MLLSLIRIKQLAILWSMWSSETVEQDVYLFTSSCHAHLTAVYPLRLRLFYEEKLNYAEMETFFDLEGIEITDLKDTKPYSLTGNIITPFKSFNLLNCYFSSIPLHAHTDTPIYTLSNLHMGIIHSSCSFTIPYDCQAGPINISLTSAHYKHLHEAGHWLK